MCASFFINPRANPELRSLYQITLVQPLQISLPDYFYKVMTILSEHFSFTYSALMLPDSRKDSLRVEGLFGIERELHAKGCPMRPGTIGKAVQTRQPLVIEDISQEPLYEGSTKDPKWGETLQSPLLCFPLITDDEPVGVLIVNSLYGPRNEFTEDFQFLSILSALLAPTIKQYQIQKEDGLLRSGRSKSRSTRLEDVLSEKLGEVLHRIDPDVESKTKMCLLDDIIAVVEKILIRSALEKVDNVQVAAAQLLGINRNTLRKKMKDLKIKV